MTSVFFEADPEVLRSDLYKRLVDKIKISSVEQWMKKCAEVGLIELYEVKGKPYGQILGFGQTLRIMRAKYPNKHGKFITQDEYRASIKTSEIISTHKSAETNPKEEEKKQETYIETWLKDLPNSTHIEDISRRTNISIDKLKGLIPEFSKAMEMNYPSQDKFLTHFKNWSLKKINENTTNTQTSVSFGRKQK